MIGSVVVMEPADFQAWLSGGSKEDSPAAAGQKLFVSLACNTCHAVENRGRGPTLAGVYGKEDRLDNGTTVVADDVYIRESILNPRAKTVIGYPAIMPTFQGQVSEEQILQLVAYIKSIGPKQNGAAGNAAATPETAPAPQQGGQDKKQ
jgi:cytochrome c oxidase subunit 2